MSNTVITNYTDLNGPSTKADSSVVVIVNKDGSLSVDENLLGTLMGSDGSQAAGISVVRVGHEGRPDDATDSESDDDQVPHVTLSVDSYFDDPNSIIKYDSGAEMLQSFRIETRENSLLGFQNDHCYTLLMSPDCSSQQKSDGYSGYDEPIIEISQQPPPKPVPNSKKITILDQKIIPKGRKLAVNPSEAYVLKGNEALHKPLGRSKIESRADKILAEARKDDSTESSSMSSSGDSIPDRDSDSDYNYVRDKPGTLKKGKLKPKILKALPVKGGKLDPKAAARLKSNKNILRKEIKDKISGKNVLDKELKGSIIVSPNPGVPKKETPKQLVKIVRKEKKTPAHVNALLTDMTSLFSTPDVIRRISTENKTPSSKDSAGGKKIEDAKDKIQRSAKPKSLLEKGGKGYDLIPQIDDASLAQILQDTTPSKTAVTTANSMNSPGLAGPLSPTLDLLGGLQPEEEGLTEDLLMHVAQLVESSENLQEVIDKQVLGKVDTTPKAASSTFQQGSDTMYTPSKSAKSILPRKDPIEIVRRDGRVITLPPIEAPATRASKRKSQLESASTPDAAPTPAPSAAPALAPAPVPSPAATLSQAQRDFEAELELSAHIISKQYVNKKIPKQSEEVEAAPAVDKASAESQESWNSEDDPNRLWCICRQPHNNRFMICCDGCEDWFHGKCVNITKVMGQQMEERGVEWRCPNCVRRVKTPKTMQQKLTPFVKKRESIGEGSGVARAGAGVNAGAGAGARSGCIVCARAARPASIYCSDACILKHAQDSLAPSPPAAAATTTTTTTTTTTAATPEKKPESRVIVFERKTGKCLAGPSAPTAENLKAWLQKNPTFEVVRPGSLSAIKPVKKTPEPGKVQTTLNFNRVPKKIPIGQSLLAKTSPTVKESPKVVTSESKPTPSPRTPVTPKTVQKSFFDTPKASTSAARPSPSEVKKPARPPPARPQPSTSKASVSPAASRRKDTPDSRSRMGAVEPIRENVRKALQEQLSLRMAETSGPKFSEKEIQDFATDTEAELYDLFKDVGVKYKAKYRSLMFNIKDRKNLTLWDKICDKSITPTQLVRLSAEELASQELAQWRDQEAKHQLELIKKSELDLLAASKTYVLKTHKGEEVMETKESVSTELDPNVAVEDLVSALNDSTGGEPDSTEAEPGKSPRKLSVDSSEKSSSKKKKDESESRSRRSTRESKRDADSRRSRRRSPSKTREEKSRRSDRKSKDKARSPSRDRSKKVEKADSSERSSRSKTSRSSKSHSRSQERERSRSRARSKRESRDSRSSRRNRSKQRQSADTKQRSRSQEATSPKGKNESTDFEAIERPKSAMMKESHPEYDPHEPMITSALSDEDLKKSREDIYDDGLLDIDLAATGYDPTKPFTIDTSTKSSPKSTKSTRRKQDKVSEAESDQEPSSTVEHAAPTVWNGCINMVDVARFYVAAHEVSGCGADLEEDLAAELDVVGRIHPATVWDYLGKMKRTGTRDVLVLRLRAANDEEQMQYIALYSYLSSRSRLGVIKVSKSTNVKDFYIIPLAANEPLPPVLLPLDGAGLEDSRNHLLIGVVVRQRKVKRPPPNIPQDIVPAKMTRSGRKRSFTPPQPPAPALPLPGPPYSSPALSTTVKDKIAASLASQDESPYSPGSGSGSGGEGVSAGVGVVGVGARPRSDRLRCKMDELNRQIEEQKQQIRKMKQVAPAAPNDDDEAYSPSRPMTPPSPGPSLAAAPSAGAVPLADIALPSNLQEMLATIKQRSGAAGVPAPADVDMRTSNT